jgi:cell wall assembly regulator SMI1
MATQRLTVATLAGHTASAVAGLFWARAAGVEGTPMGVGDSWDRIEAWLVAHAPAIRKSLRPGAKQAAVEKLEAALGATLPADFAGSARRHDGQPEDAEVGLFPVSDEGLGPLPSFRLLPLADARREWVMMKGLLDGGDFAGRQSEPARGVRADWWNVGWVPIADNGGGDYVCLDLAPGKGGTAGQVIVFFHDMPERQRLAKSFAAWMEQLARGLASGRYVLDEDEGIVES